MTEERNEKMIFDRNEKKEVTDAALTADTIPGGVSSEDVPLSPLVLSLTGQSHLGRI